MLRKRSRGVTSPQAKIGDHSNNNNSWLPHEKSTKTTSFFLNSPKFLKGFFTNSSPTSQLVNEQSIMSPISILDTNAFSIFTNYFSIIDNTKKTPKKFSTPQQPQHSWEQPNNTKGIGLALIDENNNITTTTTTATTITNKQQQQRRKLVVFGSQLRIQVPPLPQSSVFPCFSPESPREFGIKTPRSNIWPFGNKDSQVHPQSLEKGNENLSLRDMELSEDYTCVIHNGPNPKTTHIFGNCIVQSCCGIVGSSSFSATRNGFFSNFDNSIPSNHNFLKFCYHCNKKLGEGSDIYMYRGEKAFCSQECRCQEMLFDEVEN